MKILYTYIMIIFNIGILTENRISHCQCFFSVCKWHRVYFLFILEIILKMILVYILLLMIVNYNIKKNPNLLVLFSDNSNFTWNYGPTIGITNFSTISVIKDSVNVH